MADRTHLRLMAVADGPGALPHGGWDTDLGQLDLLVHVYVALWYARCMACGSQVGHDGRSELDSRALWAHGVPNST